MFKSKNDMSFVTNVSIKHVIALFSFCRSQFCLATLCLATMNAPLSAQGDEKNVVSDVLIRTVDDVLVPAREAGAFIEIQVREGDAVTAGQVVARLDNELQKLQSRQAELELEVARRELKNTSPIALANKAVELARQAALEQSLAREIAHKQAENTFKQEAAIKQMGVARNELDRALAARKEFKESVSDSEIDGRRLTFEHADLSARQTRFEVEVNALLAKAEDLVSQTKAMSIEQAQLVVDDAAARRDVAGIQVKLKENQVEGSQEALHRREIRSPIDGIVVHVNRHIGEWIEPGEPCVRIIRLNRLRAEGFVSSENALRLSPGGKVTILVKLPSQQLDITGTITFINPEIDPVNQQVRVWVEIENPDNLLRPGMQGQLVISTPAK